MDTVSINGASPAKAHEKISTLTSSTALTAATYNLAVTTNAPFDRVRTPKSALLQVETANIRWTVDGTTPTVTAGTGIGFVAIPYQFLVIDGYENITKFRMINEVASNGATVQVSYFY